MASQTIEEHLAAPLGYDGGPLIKAQQLLGFVDAFADL
jgi:hypothetical protein